MTDKKIEELQERLEEEGDRTQQLERTIKRLTDELNFARESLTEVLLRYIFFAKLSFGC